MSFIEELHKLEEFKLLGEKEEIINKIINITKPRNFEKLKLTDNECKEILEATDGIAIIEHQLSNIPKSFRNIKPKPAKLSYI